MSRIDRVLTILLLAAIIVCIVLLIYIIVTPKYGEEFTEFYLLGPQGKAANYPTELKTGERASVIVGIANHEYRTVNYSVEIWLANTSIKYNETLRVNETQVNQVYYMDSFNVTLNHTETCLEENWNPQYQTFYSFSIDREGEFKMWFLLFKDNYQKVETEKEAHNRIQRALDGDILSLNLNIKVIKC